MKGQRSAIEVTHEGIAPFASYAQVVRMLMPLARKVVFHDAKGRSLWTNDGIEEAELSMQVQLLIARFVADDPREKQLHQHSDLPQPVHVFPIRRSNGKVMGAMAIEFGDLPAGAVYRQYSTVQRVLAPLLDIIHHDWIKQAAATEITAAAAQPKIVRAAPLVAGNITTKPSHRALNIAPSNSSALPAVLRHTLIEATETLQCAFGTIVLSAQPFLLSHRLCADESDLNVSAAVDVVRSQLLRWMTVRNEPLIVNANDPSQVQFSAYKFLAWPIRRVGGPLLALLVLFRCRKEADFVSSDLRQLREIIAHIPVTVLTQLQQNQGLSVTSSLTTPASATSPTAIVTPTEPPVTAAAANKSRIESEDAALLATARLHRKPQRPWRERLSAALRDDAFELHMQRITPLHSYHAPERFEVLLRMPDAHGLAMPATFLGSAESTGLMPQLDQWVVRQVLRCLQRERALGHGTRREFGINLSVVSLLDQRFVERMIAEVRRSEIVATQLMFEVTEKVALQEPRAFQALATQLRAAGCRLTLDNCRSMAVLDHLEDETLSCIKIDGSLIRQIGTNVRVTTLVNDMLQRAGERGLESVAEQVESPLVCSRLLGAGFDYAQGFHLEAPAPLSTYLR